MNSQTNHDNALRWAWVNMECEWICWDLWKLLRCACSGSRIRHVCVLEAGWIERENMLSLELGVLHNDGRADVEACGGQVPEANVWCRLLASVAHKANDRLVVLVPKNKAYSKPKPFIDCTNNQFNHTINQSNDRANENICKNDWIYLFVIDYATTYHSIRIHQTIQFWPLFFIQPVETQIPMQVERPLACVAPSFLLGHWRKTHCYGVIRALFTSRHGLVRTIRPPRPCDTRTQRDCRLLVINL